MPVEIQLLVDANVLRDPNRGENVKAALCDYMFNRVSGLQLMTVFSDNNPVADTVQAIRCARANDIKILRVFEDPVNIGEIARRVGAVSREAVRKWTNDPTFPTPVGTGGGERPSPVYHWADIVRWLRDAKAIDMDEDLPDDKTVAEINAHIHGVRDFMSQDLHATLAVQSQHGTVVHVSLASCLDVQWEVPVMVGSGRVVGNVG